VAASTPAKPKPTPPDELPRLDNFLCFAIYSANLAYGKAYRPLLERLGLTYTQYIAVVALWEESPLTVGALGEKLFLESNTLTPILKKLEEAGYVSRQRDPADERQVLVALTAAGRRLREQANDPALIAASGLSREDFRKLQRSVKELRDNLVRSLRDD
jgi:MarR family transcriptional regulator, organic hydroperoxide resistance regulator